MNHPRHPSSRWFHAAVVGGCLLASAVPAARGESAEPRWFKGNLHTHSLWSDGDDYPEMIADRFKQDGWHFLAMSEHNRLEEGTRWFEIKPPAVDKGELVQKGGGAVLESPLSVSLYPTPAGGGEALDPDFRLSSTLGSPTARMRAS